MPPLSEALTGLMGGLGLSAASGLNTYVSLITLGLAHRSGWITLTAPYDWLGNEYLLIAITILGLIDLIGDKIPAVDHILHTLGMFLAPIASAILFASQTSSVIQIHPVILLAAGCLVGSTVHLSRSAIRPAVNVATAGTGTTVVSVIEDLIALLLSILAVVLPILAGMIAIVLLVMMSWLFFRVLGYAKVRLRQRWLRQTGDAAIHVDEPRRDQVSDIPQPADRDGQKFPPELHD